MLRKQTSEVSLNPWCAPVHPYRFSQWERSFRAVVAYRRQLIRRQTSLTVAGLRLTWSRSALVLLCGPDGLCTCEWGVVAPPGCNSLPTTPRRDVASGWLTPLLAASPGRPTVVVPVSAEASRLAMPAPPVPAAALDPARPA
jgi:hypothetical protein